MQKVNYKWVQRKPKKQFDEFDSIEEKIAKIRGIDFFDEFLFPQQDVLHNPHLMKNIELAAQRIIKAIESGERITLSYDSDCDGVCSATIMRRYLGNYTDNVQYIYSQRGQGGHGIQEMITLKNLNETEDKERIVLNRSNIKKIKETDLLILIDSSSNDTEACKYISENWCKDIVILDHHLCDKHNPHVLMVNPQQKGCEYPNKSISAAGVVFKLIQVMEDTLNQVDPWQYIDLVSVGMYADMMSVEELENRYMILHGLRNIKNTGLARILKGGKVDTFKIDCNAIGFTVAPMLNGVMRMDRIELAIDMLMEDDDNICKKILREMRKVNDERKKLQKEMVDKCIQNVDGSKKVIIALEQESTKGFNGIIAQQLTDIYHKPVVVARVHQGTISGSFRSFGGFKFKSFIQELPFVTAQGHEQAGGIFFKEKYLPEVVEFIEDNFIEVGAVEPTVVYDVELDISELDDYTLRSFEKMNKLTGMGFPQIVAKVTNATISDRELLGKEVKETVKFKTFEDVEVIKFKVNESYAEELGCFDNADFVGIPSVNDWYNFKTKQRVSVPQIKMLDYRLV